MVLYTYVSSGWWTVGPLVAAGQRHSLVPLTWTTRTRVQPERSGLIAVPWKFRHPSFISKCKHIAHVLCPYISCRFSVIQFINLNFKTVYRLNYILKLCCTRYTIHYSGTFRACESPEQAERRRKQRVSTRCFATENVEFVTVYLMMIDFKLAANKCNT
jgi:hypothetical protein